MPGNAPVPAESANRALNRSKVSDPRSTKSKSRGSQIDGQAAERPGQPAGQQGGPPKVAGLAHRGVGESDDGEAGQTVGDVDLDGYGLPDGTTQRGGCKRGKHVGERSHGPSARAPAFLGALVRRERLATRVSPRRGYRDAMDLAELLVADAAEWRTWLSGHHSESQGVWLVLAKKGTSHPTTLSYDEALDEAICFGWIDGQLGRRDNATFRRRFTPRNARSPWSQRNVAIAERLSASGRMHRSGEDEVRQAKADGRWKAAYAGQASVEVPEDLTDALIANPPAQAMFQTLTTANRYSILYRIGNAKKTETRARTHRPVCGDAGPRRDRPPPRSTIT